MSTLSMTPMSARSRPSRRRKPAWRISYGFVAPSLMSVTYPRPRAPKSVWMIFSSSPARRFRISRRCYGRQRTHSPHAPLPPEREWEAQLHLSARDKTPKASLGNMELFLTHHPWFGVSQWWWNVFRNVPMVGDTPIDDTHVDIAIRGLHALGMSITHRKHVEDAICAVCRHTRRDPLRRGVRRCRPGTASPPGHLYHDWLGVEDPPYARWVGRCCCWRSWTASTSLEA